MDISYEQMAIKQEEPEENTHEQHKSATNEGKKESLSDDINANRTVPSQKSTNNKTEGKTIRLSESSNDNLEASRIVDNVDGDKSSHDTTDLISTVLDTPKDSDSFQLEGSHEETTYNKVAGDEVGVEQLDINIEESSVDDDGDPIPSGTGKVSRDCSALDLVGWSDILPKWHNKLNQRPKGLQAIVKNGIPEPLRGEVWQLLSGAQQCTDLMDQYRILLTKSASAEQIILRDVHRTYPAHDNFRSNSGSSSLIDSLFKVCKAYAVYDEEVGYCQGLSFLVAALLLHMPEEQAFCVFVRIMHSYRLRDLFRNNFEELYLKFYQLERLLEDNMPDLYQHFSLIGIEPFTYASQWFLTVFTAKFPLNAVFYILDIFLLDGMNTIFQIALALLQASKEELLASDFEGVLKYFRVQMPKRYRDQENVQQLIIASSAISLKKLPKHAKSYEVMKQKEKLLENPVSRLQRENAKLTENNLRLEQENDDLARDLVASKIQLRTQLDTAEDKTETLNRALNYSRQDCLSYMNTISDMEDERSRLEVEVSQLKEVCRRELNRAESELARDKKIISDYKKICSQLSKRLDYRLKCAEQLIACVNDSLQSNESCADSKCSSMLLERADEFFTKIKSDEKTLLDEDACASSKQEEQQQLESTEDTTSASPMRSRQLAARENLKRMVSSESDYANRPVGALLKSTLLDSKSTSSDVKIRQLTEHIDELEVELARTKLALVEAECKCQQLTHDLNAGLTVKVSKADSNQQQAYRAAASGLSSRLGFVRAAVGSATPSRKLSPLKVSNNSPTSGPGAFSKLNNLITDRISTISQYYPSPGSQPQPQQNRPQLESGSSLSVSSSTPSLVSAANCSRDAAPTVSSNHINPVSVIDPVMTSTISEKHDQNNC